MSPARDELVARVTRHLDQVVARIESTGRDPGSLRVVAVTKGFGVDGAAAVLAAGLTEVGENYAGELVAAHDALRGVRDATWHFLGALQRNKLARLATRVDCYQSVASERDATAVASRAPGARCYVEVDVTGREGRGGCTPERTGAVVASAREAGLVVEGLMCVASPEPGAAAEEFASLRRAADALGLEGCSMGTSGDLELACRAGSTMLRLGTALLGPRPSRAVPTVA